MGRGCKIEEHERLLEINDDLVRGIPYKTIADKYNVPYFSLRRHALNHLQLGIKKQERKYFAAEKLKESIGSTIEKIDELLRGANPDLQEQMSFKDFIRLLELRAKLLGEERSPPRVEVVWGAGLDRAEEEKEEAFKIRITVPVPVEVEKKVKEAGKKKKEEREDEVEALDS